MATPVIAFKRNAVSPVKCVKDGWQLIKAQYWLILGMCIVGGMIAAAAWGILMGPMMCGLFLTFFKRRRGEPIEFGTLFKGFDYLGQSIIATLLHVVPILAIVIPAYILFYVFFFFAMVAQANDQSGFAMVAVFVVFALFWLVVIAVIMFVSIGFMFVYPLIVDRGVQGFDAVKLSFKAAMANFWGLVGLIFMNFLLSVAGMLLCFVGMYLVLPISYSAIAVAYEQVFGLSEVSSNAPPPPPVFS